MVESFWLDTKFLSKVKHPLHKHLTIGQIEGIRLIFCIQVVSVLDELL
jgi:hypothetical protein